MKQRGLMKKLSAVLLATAMTVFAFPQFSTPVFAVDTTNKLPTVEQFATGEQLKSFNTISSDAIPDAKVYFGTNPDTQDTHQWWIAGSQSEQGLTLFAASPLATEQSFELNYTQNKQYSANWNCDYTSIGGSNPIDVYPNHYGASPLRNTLQGLEDLYFTSKEKAFMTNTTVHTNDPKNDSVYSTTNKLYLAYGDVGDNQYITVGINSSVYDVKQLNNGLRVDMDYWGNSSFWLRAPRKNGSSSALVATPGNAVSTYGVPNAYALVPSFELNLSSVIFASTIPSASSTGDLTLQDTDGDGAFTLRYKADNLGSALVSYDKSKVTLTSVPKGTYLVVQNSDGAKAKQLTNETEVSASDMDLESFANCKVWLETTDTANRMTYATLATEQTEEPVAEVNGVEYTTLKEAAKNCPVDGVINILRDFELEPVAYYDTKFITNCTLNLQNHIIKVKQNYNLSIESSSILTIVTGKNGDIIMDGDNENDVFYGISNKGTLKVDGGLSAGILNYNIIDGGKYKEVVINEGILKNGYFDKISNYNIIQGGYFKDNYHNLTEGYIFIDSNNNEYPYKVVSEEKTIQLNITLANGLTSESGKLQQVVEKDTDIQPITIKANDGYYLPNDYISTLQSQLNGLTVTETDTGFTISGLLTSDVNITLPAPTQKVYGMTLNGSGTFTAVCVEYEPITAKEITITNTGNVDLENVNVSVTGKDADKFELSWDNTTTIQPNGTITVIVKPANDLAVSAYQAILSVSADNVNTVTTDLQFTVNEHDYNAVETPPTCTEKGYTTYTCKNCPYSYIGDEVTSKGHNWGEWEIIDSPTCEQEGLKKRTCIDCGLYETENLVSAGHAWEDDYTVDKEPTCTEDGSKSIHCKNCDAVKDSTTIAKVGHSFTDYVSDNNATCTKDGTKTAKCDRCDETDTLVDGGTMLEHEYEWIFNNDATCEKNGTETGTCKQCQTIMTREKADSALGHEFKNYVSDDNATCTENSTETAKCEHCDKTDTRVIENSALGHKLGEWEVIKEPTIAETGTKERLCEYCDYKETEIIPIITDEKPTTPTNPDKPNTDKANNDKDNGSVKTGDQTNVGLFIALLSMSTLGIAVLAVLKKKVL